MITVYAALGVGIPLMIYALWLSAQEDKERRVSVMPKFA